MLPASKIVNNKVRMEMLLKGEVPDSPPHFELLFFLAKEMLGMPSQKEIAEQAYQDEKKRIDALQEHHIELYSRLIDEYHWGAVPALSFGNDYVKEIQEFKKIIGDKALIYSFNGNCVHWMPTGSDLMDFIVMLFERPEEMHREARRKLDAGKELARKTIDAGVDFIIQNTDFGFNSGPFISPKHFSEFVTPYMTEFISFVHDMGVPVILHSDGDLNEILDQIYSTGVDGYQSVDPQGHMDIKQTRAKYPDWILMGNVNCAMLQDCNEQEIRQSVQYCMAHGGIGKKYVFSTSNCIFSGMPPQSYLIMLDEYKKNDCSICSIIILD